MYLLDLLDNLPRLRLSDPHMRTIMFVMKELGVKSVPSLDTLRRLQAQLREHVSVPTSLRSSSRGHIFYVNEIGAQIAKVRLQRLL